MSKRLIITGLLTSIVNLAMHTIAFAFVIKNFFPAHPAVFEEFSKQFIGQSNQLIVWTMVATSLMMGFLITLVMKWSGAITFASGLKYAFIVGFLFWVLLMRMFNAEYIHPKRITLMHIPPAEIETVKDSVKLINDFIDIAVLESSLKEKSFLYESSK